MDECFAIGGERFLHLLLVKICCAEEFKAGGEVVVGGNRFWMLFCGEAEVVDGGERGVADYGVNGTRYGGVGVLK